MAQYDRSGRMEYEHFHVMPEMVLLIHWRIVWAALEEGRRGCG